MFFQAEDVIRDTSVTGVQTCALPISFVQWLAQCDYDPDGHGSIIALGQPLHKGVEPRHEHGQDRNSGLKGKNVDGVWPTDTRIETNICDHTVTTTLHTSLCISA